MVIQAKKPSKLSNHALARFEDIRDLLPDVDHPTPLVRVRNAVALDNVYLKLEWLNPFGSIKDRVSIIDFDDHRLC